MQVFISPYYFVSKQKNLKLYFFFLIFTVYGIILTIRKWRNDDRLENFITSSIFYVNNFNLYKDINK